MSNDIKLLSFANMNKVLKESQVSDSPVIAALCTLHDYTKELAKVQLMPVNELELLLAIIETMIVQQIETKQKNKN